MKCHWEQCGTYSVHYIYKILPVLLKLVIKVFADDTKLYNIGNNSGIKSIIDLWSDELLLRPHPQKCSIMHMGRNNPKINYQLNKIYLKTTEHEKDLGNILQCDLKVNKQINECVKWTNNSPRKIKQNFNYLDTTSPSLQKDIIKLENMRRKATKMIPYQRNLLYERILTVLGLTTLKERRRDKAYDRDLKNTKYHRLYTW